MDNQQETSWLCGFIDGEGTFDLSKKNGCRVRISNTELDAIQWCENKLIQLGVDHTVSDWKRPEKKREYEICIQSWGNCFNLFNSIKNNDLCRIDELHKILGSSETTRESSSNLYWLVGVFEAEASFHISRRMSRQNQPNYNPEIGFTNKRKSIITQAVKTLFDNGLSWHISHHIPENGNHSEYDNLVIRGYKRVDRALKVISPHLITKRAKRKALLQSEFVASRLSALNGPYSKRETEIFFELRNMI